MSQWDGTMSPWENSRLGNEWELWWAWYPVRVPHSPGYSAFTFFEHVWRRRVGDRWEYQLRD
jgi:hypothetical protein